jgi:hypothetical protein
MTIGAQAGLLATRQLEGAADGWLEIRSRQSGGSAGFAINANAAHAPAGFASATQYPPAHTTSGAIYFCDVGSGGSLTAGLTVGHIVDAGVSATTHYGYIGVGIPNNMAGVPAISNLTLLSQTANAMVMGAGVHPLTLSTAGDVGFLTEGAHMVVGAVVDPFRVATAANTFGTSDELYNNIGNPALALDGSVWFEAARVELEEVLGEVDENLKGGLREVSSLFLDAVAWLSVQPPAIDLDHDQNVEFYWRAQAEALLVVIRRDASIHFFGNSKGESWRSSYLLSGSVWRSHLALYTAAFI